MSEMLSQQGTTGETLRGGDVQVHKVLLHSSQHTAPFDLIELWKNISIYEDIETNYIRGEITITDSQNILINAPVINNEKLEIEFKTPSHPNMYKFSGMITEVTSQVDVRQGMMMYVIRFITPEFIRNQKTKFSKSFANLPVSAMVERIYNNYIKDVSGKKLNIFATTDPVSRVVPMMSPFKAINWLSKWAISSLYKDSPSYIFFENQHGYYFGPIDSLIDSDTHSQPAAIYSKDVVIAQEGAAKDINTGFYQINEHSAHTPDVLHGISEGLFSSQVMSHDIVLRSIGTKSFNYFESYDKTKHFDANAIHNDKSLGSSPTSYVINSGEHYSMYGSTSYNDVSSSTRISQLSQLKLVELSITVPGDSDRTAGEVIQVDLPAIGLNTLEGTEGSQDKYKSGRYLISAIRHQIKRASTGQKDKYTLHMNVVKDSYMAELPQHLVTHFRL